MCYSAYDWLLKNGYPVSICSFVESIKDLSTCLVLKELQSVYWTTDYSLLVVNDSSVFLAIGNQVGYYFAPSGKPYPDNWIITDVIYEIEGSLFSRSGNQVEGNPGRASGDETVPYNSLSWCKSWLGPKVNITRAPQSEHDGSDVQVELNVEHHHDADIVPNMTRSPRVKYITYYEDSESIPGRRTAVWELDKANHRNIVRSPVLMRELWLQMWHDIHPDATSKFVTKAKRGPLRDEDCYWDYAKARCAWPEHCEYRYVFGDVHLGQSWGYFAQDKSYVLYTSLTIVALNDEAYKDLVSCNMKSSTSFFGITRNQVSLIFGLLVAESSKI
ncbi:hypothetical protein Pint_01687 [Pistacia integerrima]|uniref:Uncharacterized protein n=1 Tax=Pistacia integerrima TaxID=434235 RepID=A0ACC0ZMV0_9ROSI|nr:hypothetical protein Pint_01687 [Pistacia integerrima]